MSDPTTTARELAALPGFPFSIPGGCGRIGDIVWTPSDMDDWNEGGAGSPVPDLTHDANVGALLSWLREVTDGNLSAFFFSDGRCEVSVYPHDGWKVTRQFMGETDAHALALALVAVLGGSDA